MGNRITKGRRPLMYLIPAVAEGLAVLVGQ